MASGISRAKILTSIRRTGRLPQTGYRAEALEMETLASQLRDEGVIACTDGKWWIRGDVPQWGTPSEKRRTPSQSTPSLKQLSMFGEEKS